MVEALVPTLRAIRQKEFYSEPRFHASIAWALMKTLSPPFDDNDSGRQNKSGNTSLLSHNTQGSSGSTQEDTISLANVTAPSAAGSSGTPTPVPLLEADQNRERAFETIDRIPEDVVVMLRRDFGDTLTDSRVGGFEVTSLCVRIGKEIFRWKLEG